MLGPTGINSYLEPIRLHLTSDRAKERHEALLRLKEVTENVQLLSKLNDEEFRRTFQAFFKMLSIEFKYAARAETINQSLLGKLSQLLRDTKSLLMTLRGSLYPKFYLLDILGDFFNVFIPLFSSNSLEVLLPGVFTVLNCVLNDRNYTTAIPSQHASTILNFLKDYFASSNPAGIALKSEGSKSILALSKYYYETYNVKVLKELALLALVIISRDEEDSGDNNASLNFLRALNECIRALGKSFPIFCRSVLRSFVPNLGRGLFKKSIMIDEAIRLFRASLYFAIVDPELRESILEFLLRELNWTRFKFEIKNPVDIVTKAHPDDIIYPFLTTMAFYCDISTNPRIREPLKSGGIVPFLVILLAKCMEGQPIPNLTVLEISKSLSKASMIDCSWILVSLGLLCREQELPKSILDFAVMALDKTALVEAAIFFLSCHLERNDKIITMDLFEHNPPQLSSTFLELIKLNFHSKYSNVMWSESAKNYYYTGLVMIEKSFEHDLDLRQIPNKIFSLLPAILAFVSAPFCGSAGFLSKDDYFLPYLERAVQTVGVLNNFIENLASDTLQIYLSSKWNDRTITLSQALSIFKLPLLLLLRYLGKEEAATSIELCFKYLSYESVRFEMISWLWFTIQILLESRQGYYDLQVSELICFCVQTCSNQNVVAFGEEHLSLGFNKDPKEQIIAQKNSLITLTSICKRLKGFIDFDGELEAVFHDCATFILEKLVSLPLETEDLIEVCGKLPELPLSLVELAVNIIEHWGKIVEQESLVRLCLILSRKFHSILPESILYATISKVFDMLNSKATSFETRSGIISLARVLCKFPFFLQTEMSVPILESSLDFINQSKEYALVTVDDLDHIAGSLLRLRMRGLNGKDFIYAIGNLLANADPSKDVFAEVNHQLALILSSERERHLAATFLYPKEEFNNLNFLSQNVDLRCFESYWYWLSNNPNNYYENLILIKGTRDLVMTSFSPVMAYSLVKHFEGERKFHKVVKFFQDELAADFEGLFKVKILRILAFVLMLKVDLKISDSIIDQCVTHTCNIVKLSIDDIFHSIYGQILILELMDICHLNLPFALVFLMALKDILEKRTNGIIPELTLIVSNYLSSMSTKVFSPEESSLLNEITSIVKASKTLDYASLKKGISTQLDIRLGLAITLLEQLPYLSPPTIVGCLWKLIELVNSKGHQSLPEVLRFAQMTPNQCGLFNKKSHSLTPVKTFTNFDDNHRQFLYEILDLMPDNEIGRACKVISSDSSLLLECAPWIIAQVYTLDSLELKSQLNSYITWKTCPKLLAALSEGIKISCRLAIPSQLPAAPRHFLGEPSPMKGFPIQNLFLLEHSDNVNMEHFKEIYKALNDKDYEEFLESLPESLPVALGNPYNSSNWLTQFRSSNQSVSTIWDLQQRIESSMLLNQQWDFNDISPAFNPHDSRDQLFLKLRDMIKGNDKEASIILPNLLDPIEEIIVLAAKALLEPSKRIDLARKSLELWSKVRKNDWESIKDRLECIKTIESSAKKIPDINLSLLAAHVKADEMWKLGAREQSLRVLAIASETFRGKSQAVKILPEIHTRLVLWMAKCAWQTRSKTANQIRREYLEQLEITNESLPMALCSKAFHAVARFFDEQYERTSTSEMLNSRKKLLIESQRELNKMKQALERLTCREVSSYETSRKQLEQQIRQDTLEIERILGDRSYFAHKAVSNYLKALASGDKYDLTIFRICSLWFTFRKTESMNSLIQSQKLPLHKLLPLMYQLAARAEETVENGQEDQHLFQQTLKNLLLNTLILHPHHTIYQLLALRAAGNISTIGSKRKLIVAGGAQERRAQAAATIISKAKATNNDLQGLICDTEVLWNSYSEMALFELPADTCTKMAHPFDSKWSIKRIQNLTCPVPTRSIPIDPSGKYSELVTVVNFSPEGYRLIGGINLPKIVECLGSDGQRYRQLVKGRDDVRQDAVMEQIFQLVNRILGQNHQTAKKKLGMRTFRVIPLQPLTGVLEWVSDATPIGDYLHPAHEKYNPKDLSPREARLVMKKEFERSGSNPNTKVKVYTDEIIPRFQPVLHNFFLEKTLTTTDWYYMRQRYIRSAAVSSIIGYIVGLGDRHCQNIMIDQCNGELIHIDLNMIFEVGKTLRIPERVPFRLTRDLIDGMGPLGLEAGFTGAAIQVIQLLRSRADMMLMIMEAFKYDPLYRWSIKPPPPPAIIGGEIFEKGHPMEKIKSEDDFDERDNGNGGNKEAERALLRVREKLLGFEEGTILSERGQTSFLIGMATNEELLAQMYPGWQSWM